MFVTALKSKFEAFRLLAGEPNNTCRLEDLGMCGQGYTSSCIMGADNTCAGQCVTKKIEAKLDYPHLICTKDGAWVDSSDFPVHDLDKVTFMDASEFTCQYEYLY